MKRPITMCVALWFVMNITGAYENRDMFEWTVWFKGFVCMLPLATVWFFNKFISSLLSFSGMVFLVITAMGAFEGLEFNRVFFSGCSIGFVLGFLVAYLVHLPRSYKAGYLISEMDRYPALSRYFSRKIKESNLRE
ncbi:hypothetical protein A3715_18795 [Oleiphilus sp. HI0009]|nr:hypothetical protein A3715_18795 [Oleiphilus sp. HI0009]